MARTRRGVTTLSPQRNQRPLFYGDPDPIIANKLATLTANVSTLQREYFNRVSQADPRRDIDDECGYPKVDWDGLQYKELIESEPIANIANCLYPLECFKQSPSVYEDEDSDTNTEFEDAWDNLPAMLGVEPSYHAEEKGSQIWSMFLDADVLSGYGRHGAILIGLDDGKDLAEPALPRTGQKATFFRAFPEHQSRVTAYEMDPSNPRYCWPTQYAIMFADPMDASREQSNEPSTTKYVHWSRIVHLADKWHMASSSAMYAVPRLKPVRNPILDVRKIRGSSAEMYYKGAFGGHHFGTHPSLGADVDVDVAGLKDMYEEYINGLQRAIFSSGMQVDPLAPQVSDPSPQLLAQIESIAMILRIPKRKLIGNETGERSTTDDTGDWNAKVMGRCVNYVTPKIICPVIDRLINLKVLPQPKNGYRIHWPIVGNVGPLEKAQILYQKTQAYALFTTSGMEASVPLKDYMTKFDDMDEETADAIIEVSTEEQEQSAKEDQATADEHDLVPEPPEGYRDAPVDPVAVAKAKNKQPVVANKKPKGKK